MVLLQVILLLLYAIGSLLLPSSGYIRFELCTIFIVE